MEYIHFGVPSVAGRMDNIAATTISEYTGDKLSNLEKMLKTYASEFGMNIQNSLHSTLHLTAKSPLAFIYISLSHRAFCSIQWVSRQGKFDHHSFVQTRLKPLRLDTLWV